MKAKLFTLSCLLLVSAMAFTQDARSILDKASEAYDKTGGVIASFTLNTKDQKTKSTYSYEGKAYMKGNKFKIEIPDATTWFDGTTQWVYVKNTEEVNISNPTGEELQAISPSVLFNIYKKGFNLKYKGEVKVAGKTLQEIELTPQKKGSDFSKIAVHVDKLNSTFSKIILTDKSGIENTLIITKYQLANNLPEGTFSFNKSDYPRAEIVDLR